MRNAIVAACVCALAMPAGLRATTHHWMYDALRQAAPGCDVVADSRVVDNGRILTAAGVTAGIDGALHVVARLCGEEAARWAGVEWMEHPGTERIIDPA